MTSRAPHLARRGSKEEEKDDRQQTGLIMDAGHLGIRSLGVNPCRASLGFAAV